MKDIIVLYHKNCDDGFGAAWAAWKKLRDGAEYIAVNHNELPPEGLINKTIYLLDFCYNETITKELLTNNKQVTVIDHHAMREPIVRLTKNGIFDNTHSGSVLAWQYFHKEKPIPQLLLHIEDSDLWKFTLPNTKEIIIALSLAQHDFNEWESIAQDLENSEKKKQYIENGGLIMHYTGNTIAFLVENKADLVIFEGHKTFAVNCPNLDFNSALGHALVKKIPPISIVWSEHGGKRTVSLRSDSTVDVAVIAQKYGGGGHKAAAGFSISATQPLPWQPIP